MQGSDGSAQPRGPLEAEMYSVYGGLNPETASPADSWTAVIDRLLASSPEERHQFAFNWNRDYGLLPIQWIIRQPDTDLATALIASKKGVGYTYADSCRGDPNNIRDWEGAAYELLFEIRDRVDAGFYTRSEFAYTPDRRAQVWDRELLLTVLPEVALSPIKGRQIDVRNFDWPMPGLF